MKISKPNMEFAAKESEKRWANYLDTDFKTFQLPEFREQFKVLAFQLVNAEVDNYRIKKASIEEDQRGIIKDAKDDFLYFFFFSTQCQKGLLNTQAAIKQNVEEKLVTQLKAEFEIKTEVGQMILSAVAKKCRFQVGYAFDPKIDLLWEYVFRHSQDLWDNVKNEWEIAIALGEKFDITKKHYSKAFKTITQTLPSGFGMIYYPVCKNEISHYLNNMQHKNNSYFVAATKMPEWTVVQKTFGVSCEMLEFNEIATEEHLSELEVYNTLKKFVNRFKGQYRRNWQM